MGGMRARLSLWLKLLWRPSKWFIVVGIMGMVGAYDTAVAQFVPRSTQEDVPLAYELAGLIPWWAWAFGVVGGLFAVVLEGAYREVRRLSGEPSESLLEMQVGSRGWASGGMPGNIGVWFVQVTITNTSEDKAIGTRRVWLEIEGRDERSPVALHPVAPALRQSMGSFIVFPITSNELAETLYLRPLESVVGEYQFLDHGRGPNTRSLRFGIEDSTGKIREHMFPARESTP